jgi:hypothetical protein
MAKKKTVKDLAFRHTHDPTVGAPISGVLLDGLVNSCIARATAALEHDAPGYEKKHRHQISDVFKSLQYTHRGLRRFLKDLTSDDPEAVDSLALLRLQFEAMFSICLMLDDAKYVDAYVQDYWRKRLVQYLLVREECSGLANHQDYLTDAPKYSLLLRDYFGITAEQQSTVELEELGIPLPAGMTATPLGRFPTPGKVPDKIADADKKRVLERLNVEYGYLCSFAHILAEANLLKGLFDPRSTHRNDSQMTDAQIEQRFQMMIISSANLKSCICVAAATTELTLLYPNDVELTASAIKLWNTICESNLLARIVWALRAKSALRVIA